MQAKQSHSWKEHPLLSQAATFRPIEPPLCKRSQVKSIHIYDFDQTLYGSPLPNPELYTSGTLNQLRFPNTLLNRGWYGCPTILEYSLLTHLGQGVRKWNQEVAHLVCSSAAQETTLSVLLTGRDSGRFKKVLQLAVDRFQMDFAVKRPFDAVCLKTTTNGNESTRSFKEQFIISMLEHYTNVTEVSIYDDRQKHCVGFSKVLKEFTEHCRPLLTYNVVCVAGVYDYLDPEQEIEFVLSMIDEHNRMIQKQTEDGVDLRDKNIAYRPQYFLKKNVEGSGFRFDAGELRKLQTFACLMLRNEFKADSAAVSGLKWFAEPYVAANPQNISYVVNEEMMSTLLPANTTPSEMLSISHDIENGYKYVKACWKVRNVWYEPSSGSLGLTLDPHDSLTTNYCRLYKASILLAGKGMKSVLSSKLFFELKSAPHFSMKIFKQPIEPIPSYFGVYYKFKLTALHSPKDSA